MEVISNFIGKFLEKIVDFEMYIAKSIHETSPIMLAAIPIAFTVVAVPIAIIKRKNKRSR